MNDKRFSMAQTLNDYQKYLDDNKEQHMLGIKRILNAQGLVKFPYPQQLIQSIYKNDFSQKINKPSEAFNLEKVAMSKKPVQMNYEQTNTYVTTTRNAFQDPRGKEYGPRSESFKNKHLRKDSITSAGEGDDDYPFPKHSQYRKDFQNWGQGVKLVEKRPDYPKYKLKFAGKSSYKQECERIENIWKNCAATGRIDPNDQHLAKILKIHKHGLFKMDLSQRQMEGESLDRSNLVTRKQIDDKKIEYSLKKSKRGEVDLDIYRGKPYIRPKSALQGSLSVASNRLKQGPQHFATSYKQSFVSHNINKPYFVPYP